MRLSDLAGVVSIRILRDGEFESLGLLSHHAEKMLVGFYDAGYAEVLLGNRNISCTITSRGLLSHVPEVVGVALSDDPRTAFYQIHDYLCRKTDFYWKDFETKISLEAKVHEQAYVAPQNVRIGPGTVVEPNASIMERSIVGRDVVIRAGAVIGGEDLEAKFVAGKYVIVPHAGGVLLGHGAEVQGNAQVQRSVHGGFTVVGEDTKLGALAHVAHNARIGRRCFVAPCVLVGGSTVVGDDVWIGPNATLSSEIRVGDGARITLGSVVTRDVPAGGRVSGNFAIDHDRFIRFIREIR